MLHWLQSPRPHIPRHGYVLVFIVAFLNDLGVPLPGESILLGAGFVLGRTADSLWHPTVAATPACCLGGIGAFWLGRRLGEGHMERLHRLRLTHKRLLAGMSKMRWRSFLFCNLTGSAAYATT